MSFRNGNHSGARSSGCKHTHGNIFKYEAVLYIHAQLPSGELVALRMKSSDGQAFLTCSRRSYRCYGADS
jgi:hypothetical protein